MLHVVVTIPSPMFTEEQQKFINDKFSELSNQFASKLDEISEHNDKAVSGLAKRLMSTEIPKAIASQLSEFKESPLFDESSQRSLFREEMNSLLEELASEEDFAPTESTGTKSPELTELEKQLEAMKARVEASEKAAQLELTERSKLQEERRLAQMDEMVIGELRGKVRPGTEKQLLTLLKTEGRLSEDKEKNRFVIKGEDKYGLEASFDIKEVLPNMIAEQYPHFIEARGGTGTGAAPGTGAAAPSNGRYFDGGTKTLSDAEIQAIASDPEQFKGLMQELESIR